MVYSQAGRSLWGAKVLPPVWFGWFGWFGLVWFGLVVFLVSKRNEKDF